jgi:methyl-accepting chemotaxis protein
LVGTAMIVTEYVTARRLIVEDIAVRAELLSRNIVAALSFHRDEDEEEVRKILSAVQADPQVQAICVYDKHNRRFGDYIRAGTALELPTQPPADGHRFIDGLLELVNPVEFNQKRIGTIYFRCDLGRVYRQISLRAIIVGGILLSTFVVTSFLSPRLRKPIADPILALAEIAKRVAQKKEYAARAVKQGDDEIGDLTDAFNQMLDEIEKGHHSLQQSNDSMQNEIAERRITEQHLIEQSRGIAESISVLVTSAEKILATSTELASGASQTASAVTETTTTVEEVRQTVLASSNKAKAVAESSQKVVQTSLSGKKFTEETIEGMQLIRSQVESIADSMMRLSDQTQAIGQIIATVDDLAAQSNLLAVNAAIEAAKAGEQGRGFSVVAQEVRSLAEQSKQATSQVRNILSDIQKATSTAVMATEQGTKAVITGVKQSSEAGQSILALSSSVSDAAQTATQIAASSQQQLAGVDQVVSAMESIKQASMQNVTSAKQLETSAHNLNELGQKLKQMAERYKL